MLFLFLSVTPSNKVRWGWVGVLESLVIGISVAVVQCWIGVAVKVLHLTRFYNAYSRCMIIFLV